MYLGLTLCLAVSDCVCPCLDYCSHTWIISLCLALLDTVRRSKTHAIPRNTLCLASFMSVCGVSTNACFMTTPFNKALQMDPHASRFCHSVTVLYECVFEGNRLSSKTVSMAFSFYLIKYSVHVCSAALCTVVTEAATVSAICVIML